MKTWELIKALQEGKKLKYKNWKDGEFVKLKDLNDNELVDENGASAGVFIAHLNFGLSYPNSHIGFRCAEDWEIVVSCNGRIVEIDGKKYRLEEVK